MTDADTSVSGDPSRRLRSYASFCKEQLRKTVTIQMRYPLEVVGRFTVILVIFVVIFYGGQAVGGPAFDDSLGGIVVGFFVWSLASTSFTYLTATITGEAQLGMLEHLYMSVHGIGRVVVSIAWAQLAFTAFYSTVLLGAMLLITGETINVDLVTIVPITALALTSVIGVGIGLAGLALLYKRISGLVELVQFAFIGLMAGPEVGIWWTRLLPLAQGSAMLQRAMRNGTGLAEFSLTAYAVLVGTAVGNFLVGYYVFTRSVERAKRLGVLGEH